MELRVDGEVFVLSRGSNGGTHYDWFSGRDPQYGFSSSEDFDQSEADHRESIRNFLKQIDPKTGYIEEDYDIAPERPE